MAKFAKGAVVKYIGPKDRITIGDIGVVMEEDSIFPNVKWECSTDLRDGNIWAVQEKFLSPICEQSKDVFAGELSALRAQVGGDHYKGMAIQPVEYIHANNLGFVEGSVVKYVSRWKEKGGIADLEKAQHFLGLLIELETKKASK